ncbi:MAG: glycoside hydrolase family 88 protein [Lachnospiraceae bacterium]|nr:glycoside hydrolase family 88 protein [Lachnospiraceae bacterium]
MEAGNYMNEYFKNYRYRNEYGDYEDGCALLAAKQLYEVSGDEAYFFFVKNYADAFVSEDGGIKGDSSDTFSADWVHGSRILFFLYQVTKEEKYHKAFEAVMNRLCDYPRCESGNFTYRGEQPEEIINALYRIQPFYMEYETVYGKKEKYNDIIVQFENARKIICGEENGQCRSIEQYLVALVDTMDNMSIQIYEQYRKLQDMFKETLKAVLEKQDAESALIGYCILKACRMGILLKEKYVGTGMEIVEKLAAQAKSAADKGCSTEEICTFIMAYGQYLQTKKEMED